MTAAVQFRTFSISGVHFQLAEEQYSCSPVLMMFAQRTARDDEIFLPRWPKPFEELVLPFLLGYELHFHRIELNVDTVLEEVAYYQLTFPYTLEYTDITSCTLCKNNWNPVTATFCFKSEYETDDIERPEIHPHCVYGLNISYFNGQHISVVVPASTLCLYKKGILVETVCQQQLTKEPLRCIWLD